MIRAAARAGLEARSTAFARATTKPELDQTRLECIALQAALSTLLQGESREELVEVLVRAEFAELSDRAGVVWSAGDPNGYREIASAALDALASHLLGEQKPDE